MYFDIRNNSLTRAILNRAGGLRAKPRMRRVRREKRGGRRQASQNEK